jgi:RNA polymerase sigma factor (sigma-70 family)
VNVLEHQKWVAKIARKFASPASAHYEDLIQEGMLALIQAAASFDESRGVKFLTYATPGIRREMRSFLRRSRQVHVSDAVAEGRKANPDGTLAMVAIDAANVDGDSTVYDAIAGHTAMHHPATQEDAVISAERAALVKRVTSRTSDRNRSIFESLMRGESAKDVAKRHNINNRRVQQIAAEIAATAQRLEKVA